MSMPYENQMSPKEGTEELRKAYEVIQKHNKAYRSFVLLHLNPSAIYICSLNKYELNDILTTYLGLWSSNPDLEYVPVERLISHFPDTYTGLLKSFFVNPRVTCSDYVIFVCFFTFYDLPQFVPVFLTMSHILSNVFVCQEQLYSFFSQFGLKIEEFNDLKPLLKGSTYEIEDCPTNAFSVKVFEHYLKTNLTFTSYIYQLKTFLLDYCIEPATVSRIQERKLFYYSHTSDNISVVEKPKETCLNKCYRQIFTYRPEPYHYDYAIKNTSEEKAKEEIVLMIKKRFGYSMRGSSLLNWNHISKMRNTSRYSTRITTPPPPANNNKSRKHANSYAIGPGNDIKMIRNNNSNNNIDDDEKKNKRQHRSLVIDTGNFSNNITPFRSPMDNKRSGNEIIYPHKISVEHMNNHKIFPL